MRIRAALFAIIAAGSVLADQPAPNVVIVITDDQGWGDTGFSGNPWIETPAIDRLCAQSTLLGNYHVDPTCAPTRSALMTGRYSDRVGVWHTIQGRNMLRRRETTMADVFTANGYATGMFGKWHLGDVYPYRPQDRGFQRSVWHGGGGVGQGPDYWGNDYFDDTYIVDGEHHRFEGYCTDVWFEQGMEFIKANKGRPFLAYIAPNAPHTPLYCPEKYVEPYKNKPGVINPVLYGMIANIDENLAKLVDFLDAEGLAENTILVFTTDNGTAQGISKDGKKGFTAGMRGKKGSEYDGGHRVPFMIRWPNGKIDAGKRIDRLTAHIDILPTLIDLCGLDAPEIAFDGTSLRDLLYTDGQDWPNRELVVESQRVVTPVKWRKCAVMTDQWRLVNGKKLFNMQDDFGQSTDVASQHPETAERLKHGYETFWADVSAEHDLTSYMVIGSDRSPVVTLCAHDWLVEGAAWNQSHIKKGERAKPAKWALEVEQSGDYEISLRRWPVEADKPINDGTYGKAFNFKKARMRIGNIDQTIEVPESAKEVTFKVHLEKGVAELAPLFIGDGVEVTPYYAYVTHQPKPGWQTPQGMNIPVYDPNYGRVPPQLKGK